MFNCDNIRSQGERFQDFLVLRGIHRKGKSADPPILPDKHSDGNRRTSSGRSHSIVPTIVSNERDTVSFANDIVLEFDADDNDSDWDEEDEMLPIPRLRNDDNQDADVFYDERRESFSSNRRTDLTSTNSGANDTDRYFEYPKSNSYPTNSESAYTNWELRQRVSQDKRNLDSKFIDAFSKDYTTIENTDPSRILRKPLAEMYKDGLRLKHIGIRKLHALENIRRFKNNISTIINDSDGRDYLVLASNSELIIFDFDDVVALPNKKSVLRFDTRPPFTSTTDRLISTWPYFPHTVNFIRTFNNFCGRQVLGACIDDGSLMLWYTDTIIKYIKSMKIREKVGRQDDADSLYRDTNRFHGLRVNPDFKFKLEASVWGLDFLNYNDTFGNSHNLIVASDNSQSVTLFYYHQQDSRFYHVKSHQILHNIPEVSFVSHEVSNEGCHLVKVSCACISGELLIFQFEFRIKSGPLDQDEYEYFKKETIYYIDSTMEIHNRDPNLENSDEIKLKKFKRISFLLPRVLTRTVFGEDCWTTKPISSTYFNEVDSLAVAIGDPFLREEKIVKSIMNESAALDLDHLGFGANWQFFQSRVVSISSETTADLYKAGRITGIDDEYRRIHKGIQDLESENFLVVSTTKKLALFRADTLFCTCATKRVFDLAIPFNEEVKFSNRMSITCVIPKLSCIIAVSQLGLATIMRLCCSRGVYAMRQEHIFPNALGLALGYNGYRTISGLAVREKSILPRVTRYFVYLSYTDGIVVAYDLQLGANDELFVSSV
ncbi:predicted protein [Scheffersomyces stipitis CBS 6054]|uniref:Uncharacterized protein n=1 Tax=Scheffersomyces stipitis (strain ATCC 58785 / CBS 6054 / NBRC 10063 / NRRL Y-11545) TaxID=322104 RepID=A3LXP3_PICST|nr:predicted protein [Scheffersomyces stipitis CBS 6054]ABN67500.2 predicted protein [Scheffersomyces stipitis CBS 6054]